MKTYSSLKAFTGLLLGVIAILLFVQSTGHDFVNFDDRRILLDHPELYDQPRLLDGVKAILFEAYPREEPLLLRDLSWAIDSRLFGFANATGYHTVTILLHGIVVMLLFVFLSRTTQRFAFSVMATAAYMILAVHVEPVVWIMGRKDVLSTVFAFLTLITYLGVVNPRSRRSAIAAYIGSLFFLVCGIFSKINLVVLPGVLFLLGLLYPFLSQRIPPDVPVRWFRSGLREGLRVLPHFAIGIVVFLWYGRILTAFGLLDRGYTATFPEHLKNLLLINPLVILEYVKKLLFAQDLALLYGWPSLDGPFTSLDVVVSGLVGLAVLAIGVILARRRKDLFFYYASFFLLLLPYMNLKYIGIWMADRYLYTAAFCFTAILADILLAAWHTGRPAGRLCAVAVALVFAGTNLFTQLTYQRAWANSETLWIHNLAQPNPPVQVYNSLAQYYFTQARDAQHAGEKQYQLRKAETVIESAFDLYWADRGEPPPGRLYQLFFLKALVLQVKGEPLADQLTALETAAALAPEYDAPHWHLAMFYYDEALRAERPEDRKAHAEKSLAYYRNYVNVTYKGAEKREQIKDELADYASDFPSLAKELKELR